VRAVLLHQRLSSETRLVVHQPKAGMFAMVNVSSTGMDGNAYAMSLLEHGGVAVMPGVSFGTTIDDWVRIALTVDDSQFQAACDRIIQHSKQLMREST
jgi:arginine:pyruvate transaminase